MKLRYIVIGIVAIVALIAPSVVQALSYGDVVCSERFEPRHIYFCTEPNGMLHGFNTYEEMNAYYMPPLTEVFVPETTYIYIEGGPTETLSGK